MLTTIKVNDLCECWAVTQVGGAVPLRRLIIRNCEGACSEVQQATQAASSESIFPPSSILKVSDRLAVSFTTAQGAMPRDLKSEEKDRVATTQRLHGSACHTNM